VVTEHGVEINATPNPSRGTRDPKLYHFSNVKVLMSSCYQNLAARLSLCDVPR